MMDERVAQYVAEAEAYNSRFGRIAGELTAEQLAATVPGIDNSIGWLIRHCADEYWYSYGELTGEQVPVNLDGAGFPTGPGGFQPAGPRPRRFGQLSFDFDRGAPGPGPSAAEHLAYLERAWAALRVVVVERRDQWAARPLVNWRDQECSGWWFLDHFLLDTAYHAGQASYLQRMLTAA